MEYNSETLGGWVEAITQSVNHDGTVNLDVRRGIDRLYVRELARSDTPIPEEQMTPPPVPRSRNRPAWREDARPPVEPVRFVRQQRQPRTPRPSANADRTRDQWRSSDRLVNRGPRAARTCLAQERLRKLTPGQRVEYYSTTNGGRWIPASTASTALPRRFTSFETTGLTTTTPTLSRHSTSWTESCGGPFGGASPSLRRTSAGAERLRVAMCKVRWSYSSA